MKSNLLSLTGTYASSLHELVYIKQQMSKLRKSTVIEGVATTRDKDSQGEILDLSGADISPLERGAGFVNSDHSGRFEHLLGRVTYAKKINKAEDCETPYQVKAWSKLKRPFLATKMELWDGVGHKEADAVAAIYQHYVQKGEEPPIKISVEGKVLERDSKNKAVLKRTLIKGLALTVQPANQHTMTEVVGMVKSMGADSLMKSESPDFIECPDEPVQRLYQLALVAKQLLKGAVEARANTVNQNGKKPSKG